MSPISYQSPSDRNFTLLILFLSECYCILNEETSYKDREWSQEGDWSMLGQVTVEATLRMERQPQDPWLGQDGESYSATPAPQCFMWGPPHRQGRLCATCRLYCRKHGDLKMPIQSEAISWQTYWWSPVEVTCSTGSSREYPSKILTGKVCSKDPSCRLNFELHIHNIDSTGLQRYPPAVAGGETTLCSN